MKGLFGVAILAAVVLVASATPICEQSDQELKDELQCMRGEASEDFNAKFDSVNKHLQCDSDFCTIRKLCAEPDFMTALEQLFTEDELIEFIYLANVCSDDDRHNRHPPPHHH
ncbi:antimicrobial peptide microplusin-like [Ornithodoros turicata]|uniref:antimicrobial peptide microplusin-like n=1 Tax=Ornithodoros turicata TaxID=34597 RepID=UPI00313925A0